jgi:hypothetical protein
MKFTSSGVEPATFRLVALCLNHYATACPYNKKIGKIMGEVRHLIIERERESQFIYNFRRLGAVVYTIGAE